MGCQSMRSKRKQDLPIMIKKLKFQVQIKVKNITVQCMKKEKQLTGHFKSQKSYRQKGIQKSLTQQIVRLSNQIHIYSILIHQIDKINNYSHHINNWSKAIDTLHPSFRKVLYMENILMDSNVNQVCQRIRKYDKQLVEASQDQISDEILKYHKNQKDPSDQMCSQYILRLCNQEQLNIEYINSIGHNFRYGL